MEFLTKQEQMLLGSVPDLSVVDIAAMRGINSALRITTGPNLMKTVHNLIKKSVLLSLKKGLYYTVKPGSSADMLRVAGYVFEGYLGLGTALFIHGARSDYPTVIQIVTPGKTRSERIVQGTAFAAVPFGKLCYGSIEIDGMIVSSRGKTLFDCVFRPDLVGDLGSLFRLIRMAGKEDFAEFIEYADDLKKASFYERAGYILESAGAPKHVVDELRKRLENRTVVANLGRRTAAARGKFIGSWGVYDNIGIQRFAVG